MVLLMILSQSTHSDILPPWLKEAMKYLRLYPLVPEVGFWKQNGGRAPEGPEPRNTCCSPHGFVIIDGW